jgi:hypothetical protein
VIPIVRFKAGGHGFMPEIALPISESISHLSLARYWFATYCIGFHWRVVNMEVDLDGNVTQDQMWMKSLHDRYIIMTNSLLHNLQPANVTITPHGRRS